MSAAIVDRKLLDVAGGSEHFLGAGTYKPSPVERINSVFHFPSIFHLRNLKNGEKAAISCVLKLTANLAKVQA